MADKPAVKSSGKQSQPDVFPTTTPLTFQSGGSTDYSFVLPTLMEIQRGIGKLDEAVNTLKSKADEQGKKLEGIDRKIYAAIAILAVCGAVLGFLINKGVDLLIQLKAVH
jgi:hypothetical protein